MNDPYGKVDILYKSKGIFLLEQILVFPIQTTSQYGKVYNNNVSHTLSLRNQFLDAGLTKSKN